MTGGGGGVSYRGCVWHINISVHCTPNAKVCKAHQKMSANRDKARTQNLECSEHQIFCTDIVSSTENVTVLCLGVAMFDWNALDVISTSELFPVHLRYCTHTSL